MERVNKTGAWMLLVMVGVGIWYHRFDIIGVIIVASIAGSMAGYNE